MAKSRKKGKAVNVYIDGFNMYHAIDDIRKQEIKWVNYYNLSESFIRSDEYINCVYLFTSITPWGKEKKERHEIFIAAQKVFGVEVIEARFKKNRRHCRSQDRKCKFWEEKENDVAIAVQMLADAHAKRAKRMILITADQDQIPALKYLKKNFWQLELSLAVPPKRKDHARPLSEVLGKPPIEIDEKRLRGNALPESLNGPDGLKINRPAAYKPQQD